MSELRRVEEKRLRFEAAAENVPSGKHPKNEDAVICDEYHGLFGVFDGVGGHAAGEVASHMARDAARNAAAKFADDLSPEEMREALVQILSEISVKIAEKSLEDERYERMKTTASLVMLCEEGGKTRAVIANVGDSRVYRFSPAGGLDQITLDDAKFTRFFPEEEARRIQKELSLIEDPEKADSALRACFYTRNYISQALGGRMTPRTYIVDVEPGDTLLVTSDGIHDPLTDRRIEEILKKGGTSAELARALVGAAGDERGPRAKTGGDDMSAVAVRF